MHRVGAIMGLTLYPNVDKPITEIQLQKFVRDEVKAEREQIYQAYRRPIAARVLEGICLTRLKFLYEQIAGGYVYQYKDNSKIFQFVEGDLVVINDGDPEGDAIGDGVLMWIAEVNQSARTLTLEYAHELPEEKEPPTDREQAYMLDKGFFDFNSAALLSAVKLAFNDSPTLNSILQGDFSNSEPSTENVLYLSSLLKTAECSAKAVKLSHSSQALPAGFTEKQRMAFEKAFSEKLSLIQGPPGTGKTHLLAQLILQALKEGKKILVSAFTHAAINNLLEAVALTNPGSGKLFKLSGRAKTKSLPASIDQIDFDPKAIAERLEQPIVIGATAYQAYKMRQFELPPFDLIVIDEAAQVPIPHALAAMICGDTYVLAGDHKQLPPILKAHEPDEEVAKSIFERLHELYPHMNVALNVTFRMNNEINEFPSKTFYRGTLKPSPKAALRTFSNQNVNTSLQHITERNESVTFVEVQHSSASKLSRLEADVVANIACSLLVEHEIPPSELGIISPHRQHNNEIRRRMEKLLYEIEGWPVKFTMKQLTIDTVEKMQGREREVVILSLCASKKSYLKARAHFLYKPNRLNVAITRCRSRLFVVGSKHFFPAVSKISMNPKHAKIFNDYHEYLQQRRVLIQNEGDSDDAHRG